MTNRCSLYGCNKVRFMTRKDAARWREKYYRRRESTLRVYFSTDCGAWHHTTGGSTEEVYAVETTRPLPRILKAA